MSVINTNTKALAAQASLSNVNNKLAVSMERLSTGLRINSAKDDAAGLAIASRMTADIRGFAVAIRNANDGISMAQTAEGAMGQVSDMLQRMRELAVQSSNGSLNADNRAASQLEVAQLKAQIDDIAKQTNFNGIKLLDGSAGKIDLQTGVRAGELMSMAIDSVSTKDIGLGSRASLTSTAFSGTAGSLNKSTAAGDLMINGVTIRASNADDDTLSSTDKASSAISKVAAINASSAQTGVTATVGNTTVGGSAMSAGTGTGSITINGVATADFSTSSDAGASRAVTVAAINAISQQTGVRAIDTGDVKKGVVLVADDGRNIEVAFTTLTAAKTGVGSAAVYTGTYQLASTTSSPISIGVSSNGTLSNAGLTAGSYSANVSAMSTVDRLVTTNAAGVKQLNAGDLRINGTAIVASSTADDTASDINALSSTKAASAIAIAAAINKASAQTGVTATAAPNEIVGGSDGVAFASNAAADFTGKKLWVNGTEIDLSSLDADANAGRSATRSDIASLINQYTGQTGVSATDNGRGLSLVAADGRNVSLGGEVAAAKLGILGASYSAAATDNTGGKTTYARVTLQSDKSFTLEGGSDGNANFELLGFKTGTYGGVDNGVKVAQIDISTQAGAQVALTALDSALKSVSLNQAKLGAFQNRLDAVVANLNEVNQNMSASRSRIQDTDYASETTNLAKSQIIQQAATAMLAQANQSSQSVLSLLK